MRVVGLLTLALAVVGCGGGAQSRTGAGGATGTAGGSGTAGTNGSAGVGGSAGTGGSADGGGDADAWIATGCQTSSPPPSALVTDFETVDGGAPVIALGPLTPIGSRVALIYENGGLRLQGSAGFDRNQPSGAAIVFPTCVDGRAYDGVSFSVGGLGATLCRAQFSSVDTAHAPAGGMFDNGSGVLDAAPPGYIFLPDLFFGWDGSTTMTVRFAFSRSGDANAYPAQNPATPTDPAGLVGLEWVFTSISGTNSCSYDIVIDDVRFYSEGDGGADAPVDTAGGG